MFRHNLKYTLKTLFKNKSLVFWTFAFPLILGTLFFMAFKDIENNEKLDIIEIAIIENDQFKNSLIYQESFKSLSDENNPNKLFNIKYTTLKEAEKLLEEDKITGYLILEDKPKITISRNGINETIFKNITEEIYSNSKIIENIIKESMKNGTNELAYKEIEELITSNVANIKDTSRENLSYTMIEFYTLIAMTCLYCGTISMYSLNQTLPNMSNLGKRISSSSIPKSILILSSVIASYIVELLGLLILFLYTIFVLNIDYGTNLPLIIVLALSGALAGLSLGIFISSVIKRNEGTKIGIIISISMLGSFLSGMMGITMKYVVDSNAPLINKINPVNMITDGLYSLYYYDTLNRYTFNVISLLIFSIIMLFISYLSLRRTSYDSI